MKKYTIIYAEYINTSGSHTHSMTQMKHIECEPTDLSKVVDKEVGWSAVWFILDGHCQTTND